MGQGNLGQPPHGAPGRGPAATQPGIEPGSVVMPQALRCSALDRCTTWEAQPKVFYLKTDERWGNI